jgi:hypothetical protein
MSWQRTGRAVEQRCKIELEKMELLLFFGVSFRSPYQLERWKGERRCDDNFRSEPDR